MALLRKIEKWTPGCLQAWEDTFMNWESLTKALVSYPKAKLEEGQISDTFHRSVGKRRASHQSADHDTEVSLRWKNPFHCDKAFFLVSDAGSSERMGQYDWVPVRLGGSLLIGKISFSISIRVH